jgi:hypothetical protein
MDGPGEVPTKLVQVLDLRDLRDHHVDRWTDEVDPVPAHRVPIEEEVPTCIE